MAMGIVSYWGQKGAFTPYQVDREQNNVFFFDPMYGTDLGAADTQASSGSSVIDSNQTYDGARLKVSAGAATAGQGMNVQWRHYAHTPDASKKIYFRAKLRFTGSVTTEFFCGLAPKSSTLIASSALSNKAIGFAQLGDDGNIDCLTSNATDGSAITETLAVAAALDTEYDLQFLATTSKVRYWVNGIEKPAITTNIPTVALCPAIVLQGGGSGSPIAWLECMYASRER